MSVFGRWDNFKNTQWDSMGLRDKVGQDKYLKLVLVASAPVYRFV
jgi:hypothetical protein